MTPLLVPTQRKRRLVKTAMAASSISLSEAARTVVKATGESFWVNAQAPRKKVRAMAAKAGRERRSKRMGQKGGRGWAAAAGGSGTEAREPARSQGFFQENGVAAGRL